jgi:hypothetical protein
MLTNKAIIIAKEIDSARCKGQWQAIPELARRYKKHNPAGKGNMTCFFGAHKVNPRFKKVLEQSILAEAKLYEIKNKRNASYNTIQQQIAGALHEKENSTEINTQKEVFFSTIILYKLVGYINMPFY